MSLRGLPDLARPQAHEVPGCFAGFDRSDAFLLLPEGLELSHRDGRPDFGLQLVRPQDPSRPPAPHGWLRLGFRAAYATDQHLARLRHRRPRAVLQPIPLRGGFVRVDAVDADETLPDDLRRPREVPAGDPAGLDFLIRLQQTAAELLVASLERGALPYRVVADLQFTGVAARSPHQVRFDPERLLPRLVGDDADDTVAWSRLVERVSRDVTSLPLELDPAPAPRDPASLARAFVDRLCARFGRHAPASPGTAEPRVRLATGASDDARTVRWDLSAPTLATRAVHLRSHALDAAARVARERGPGSLVERHQVPSIRTGEVEVRLVPNLPRTLVGVLDLGVTVSAAANPPDRPAAVVETVRLAGEPVDVRFQLSPGEDPTLTLSTFAVLQTADGIREVRGEKRALRGSEVVIALDTFPFGAFRLRATQALQRAARLEGSLRWSVGDARGSAEFSVEGEDRGLALAMPAEVDEVTLDIGAKPFGRGRPVRSSLDVSGGDVVLDLASFPGYGPHTVEIENRFREGEAVVAVELRCETAPAEEASVLHFTPERPVQHWSYAATSPFEPGYLLRVVTPERGAWSVPLSPFARLVLEGGVPLDEGSGDPSGEGADQGRDRVDAFDHEGVRCYADGPGRYRYVPGAPLPERDDDGRVAVNLIDTGSLAMLTVGSEWVVRDDVLGAIRAEILASRPDLIAVDLRPAPVEVREARLVHRLGDSREVLASSGSSGFPPFSAVFSVTLQGERREAVRAALMGGAGAVEVEYLVGLPPAARARADGPHETRTASVAAWLDPERPDEKPSDETGGGGRASPGAQHGEDGSSHA